MPLSNAGKIKDSRVAMQILYPSMLKALNYKMQKNNELLFFYRYLLCSSVMKLKLNLGLIPMQKNHKHWEHLLISDTKEETQKQVLHKLHFYIAGIIIALQLRIKGNCIF